MAAVLGVAILAVIYGAAYTAWERVSRAQAAEQKSSESLAGARAAIEAGDLALADQRAAEAAGHIALYRNRLPDAAIAVDRVRYEIESRRAEANRFQSFLRQVADSYGTAHVDTRTYREQIGEIEAALNTYGVLAAADDWTDQLDKVYLTPTERGQVREVAYVGLVYLADYRMRWHRDDPRRSAQQSLENLRQAEAFHPPTRAFYFVRGECHRKLNDTAAAEADEKQFAQTPAVTAWDHFLPGHTAGWNGDIDEAIRSYRAALRVQPDHYPSLFFLAERLAKRKYEYAEAIGICTACIALRRDKVVGYLNRAECYANLGQLAEAEADYVSAYSTASNVYSRIGVVQALRKFHKETGREDKAKEDAARLVDLHTTLVADHRRDHGPAHEKTLSEMNNLAVALVDVGRLADALTQIEQAKKAARESGQKEPAYRVQNLAALYGRMGRHEDSIHLLTGLLKTCEATPNHPDLPETAHQLGHAYERANRPAEAVPFFERSLAKLKSRGDPERKKILEFSICLGRAYEPTGQSAKAIELFEPLLQQWTAKEGPDHEETIVLMDDLARAYDRGGRVADGIHLHERHVDKCKAKYGPKHTKTLVAMNNLALAYVDSERLPEAIALYEQTLTQRLALSGPDHSEAIVTASNLASAYLSVGRLEEAERKYRNILERRPEATPHANPNVIALSGLGRALLFQKRYREAETVLRECVAIQEKLMPTSWLRFYATSMLGGAIFEQGRHAEAEPLLLSGYEGIRQRERVLSPSGKKRLTEAGERIVRLYEATGRPDQAQDWRQKLPTPGPLPSK